MTPLAQWPEGCHGCNGSCCRSRYAGLPPRNADEQAWLAAKPNPSKLEIAELHLRAAVMASQGFPRAFSAGPCIQLDEGGRCKIYDERPLGCRDFFATDECRVIRVSKGLAV